MASIKSLIEDKPKTADHKGGIILREVTCGYGKVELEIDFKSRFDYARAVPILEPVEGGIVARWQEQSLFLQSPAPLKICDGSAQGTFTIKEGEIQWLVLQYDDRLPMRPEECRDLFDMTTDYWLGWVHRCEPSKCVFGGPWHELVVRSSLALKLLTHPETGAIAAAPTTSLPEDIGGARNWDYRFAWVRDASFTVQAFYSLGYVRAAMDFLKWITSICGQIEDPSKIRPVYGQHGELDLEEQTLDHLSGYRNSRPVRIGNAAVNQKQLDIYGELINAIYETTRYGEDILRDNWPHVRNVVDYVCHVWNTEDAGIWEVRRERRHFVHSKLMCWVALDRGIKVAELKGFEAPP